MKYFVYLVILIVVVAVVGGFFVAGSPQQERLRRFDQRRIQDLSQIQSQVIDYWQNKSKLPEALAVLNDDLRGVSVPVDPETGMAYEYEIRGGETFALCANFKLAANGDVNKDTYSMAYPVYPGGSNWEHPVGHACFERKIDRDFLKPVSIPAR